MDPDAWDEAVTVSLQSYATAHVVVRTSERDRLLSVLEASTPEQRRLGLMFRYRRELTHDGMLFKYPSEVVAKFYMHNTWMPLRIYFFDGAGLLVDMSDMEAMSSRPHSSSRPFQYALEVPMDIAARLGTTASIIV